MSGKIVTIAAMWLAVTAMCAGEAAEPSASLKLDNFDVSARVQYDAVRPGERALIEVRFKLGKGWHSYADPQTAPGGMSLKLTPSAAGITFEPPIFPIPSDYYDPSAERHLKAYLGDFAVYVPFVVQRGQQGISSIQVDIGIKSAVCTDQLCTIKEGRINVPVNVSATAAMDKPAFVPVRPGPVAPKGSLVTILPLAILAGLALNIMPCVWPVLPIVIMRLISHSGQTRARSLLFGLVFSAGILLFFLAFAVANIVLRVGFGTAFSFADISQNADYLVFMSLVLMVLAMFMFGVFNVAIPAWLAGRAGSGSGVIGTMGTGFLAAVLATPCSFGILVAVLVWAQSQPIPQASLAIMMIGVGMALPYVVLTGTPQLMRVLPKPGRWMDIFKQAVGYILLVIAVKQVAGLPHDRLVMVLYYAPMLAFAVWMWGSWVNVNTPAPRRLTVRLLALVLAVLPGLYLLPATPVGGEHIQWQPYSTAAVDEAVKSGRPVLIDFTAAWCFNCTAVDKVVYSRHDIADLVAGKGVLPIRADVTLAEYPASAALKALGQTDIPLNVLYIPGATEPRRFSGVLIGGELKKSLESLPDRKAEPQGEPSGK